MKYSGGTSLSQVWNYFNQSIEQITNKRFTIMYTVRPRGIVSCYIPVSASMKDHKRVIKRTVKVFNRETSEYEDKDEYIFKGIDNSCRHLTCLGAIATLKAMKWDDLGNILHGTTSYIYFCKRLYKINNLLHRAIY